MLSYGNKLFFIPFKDLCITENQVNCASNFTNIPYDCYGKCEGMDIISYDVLEIAPKMATALSRLYEDRFTSKFDQNPALTKYISKLAEQYNKYKEAYNFPTKVKSNTSKDLKLKLKAFV